MQMKKKGEWIRNFYRILQVFPFIQGVLYYVEISPSDKNDGTGKTRFIHGMDLRSISRSSGPDRLLTRDSKAFFPLQGLFVEQGILYQVFSPIEGDLMAHHLYQHVPLSFSESVHILRAVTGSLVPLYERQEFTVVHPQNMILLQEEVRFLYGGPIGMLPKRGGASQPPAPAEDSEKEERMDAYAIAALGYIMLTGTTPTPTSKIKPIHSFREDVPKELENLIMESLMQEPRVRPTVTNMAQWLRQYPVSKGEEKKNGKSTATESPDRRALEGYLFQLPVAKRVLATDALLPSGWEGWEAGDLPQVEPLPLPTFVGPPVWKKGEILPAPVAITKESTPSYHGKKKRMVLVVGLLGLLLGAGTGGAYLSKEYGFFTNETQEAARFYGESIRFERADDTDKAILNGQQAVLAAPAEEAYFLHLAGLYRGQGEYQRAATVLEEGLKHRQSAPLYDEWSVYLIQAGEMDKAEGAVKKALQLDKKNPQYYYHLGKIYGMKKQYDQGIKALEKALQLNSGQATYHSVLSSYLVGKKEFARAIEAAKQATKLKPRKGEHWMRLGQAYLAEREQLFRKGGDSKETRKEMAKRSSAAIQSFQKATQLQPKNGEAFYYLSIAQYFYGSYKEAEKNASFATRYSPNQADCHYHYGVVLQRNKERQKALTSYKQALKLEPDNLRFQKGLQQLEKN